MKSRITAQFRQGFADLPKQVQVLLFGFGSVHIQSITSCSLICSDTVRSHTPFGSKDERLP
ncbi:hypothetical protein IQ274_30750 [Nostoc sp. LEGE 12447]|nr:hypothetical protein [Nostoc sp. LEGE 12447]